MGRRLLRVLTAFAMTSVTGCPSLDGISTEDPLDAALVSTPDATAPEDSSVAEDAAAPATCDAPDGGLPCTAGSVHCGTSDCPSSSSYCCLAPDGGSAVCASDPSACPSSSFKAECDEALDCPAGQVCCVAVAGGQVTASCAAACFVGGIQACHSKTECQFGQPCVPQNCFGYAVELCGQLCPAGL